MLKANALAHLHQVLCLTCGFNPSIHGIDADCCPHCLPRSTHTTQQTPHYHLPGSCTSQYHTFNTCTLQTTGERASPIQDVQPSAKVATGVDVASIDGCAPLATLPPERVDLLVHNAGVQARDTPTTMDMDDATRQYNVNALGPVRAVQTLLPRLAEGARIIVISSKMGSFRELDPAPRLV